MANEEKPDREKSLLGRCTLSEVIGNPVLLEALDEILGKNGDGILPRGDVSAPVMGNDVLKK